MNPRTLWARQPVAVIISARVAPFLRRSRARTVAFLLPSRAVAAFAAALRAVLAGLALAALAAFVLAAPFAFLPVFGATLAAVFVCTGASAALWISFSITFVIALFLGRRLRSRTSITQVCTGSKSILRGSGSIAATHP